MLVLNDPCKPTTPSFKIPLGHGQWAIVDLEDWSDLMQHTWCVKRSKSHLYPCRKLRFDGREIIVKMHREIMQTPWNEVCHHKDGNTFNCRRSNLVNMTKRAHDAIVTTKNQPGDPPDTIPPQIRTTKEA